MGTRHQPHCARSCELALRAVGASLGRPGVAPLAWVWGVQGPALSHPRPPVLQGVWPGPTTHWLWVRGLWGWGPLTDPTARALASYLCALWGRDEDARGGGGASCLAVGRPGLGAHQRPTARPLGRAAGAHYPLAMGAGFVNLGTRHQPYSAPSCELALRAVGVARGRPGGRLLPAWCVWGRALSQPRPPVLGGCGRGPLPTGCGCGGGGRGDAPRTPQCALLRAGFARCGGGTRAPRGGVPCLCVGRPGSGALPSPTARPLGRAAGAHYPLAVGGGDAGVGTGHQPHSARSCELT